MAQLRNVALWLRPAKTRKEFQFQLPRTAKTEFMNGVWFLALERTWLAVRPVALAEPKERPRAEFAEPPKGNEKEPKLPRTSFDEFKRAVQAKSRLDGIQALGRAALISR